MQNRPINTTMGPGTYKRDDIETYKRDVQGGEDPQDAVICKSMGPGNLVTCRTMGPGTYKRDDNATYERDMQSGEDP